jgi:hypothetical protein
MFASFEGPSLRSSAEVVLLWKMGSAERAAGGAAENRCEGRWLLEPATKSPTSKKRVI